MKRLTNLRYLIILYIIQSLYFLPLAICQTETIENKPILSIVIIGNEITEENVIRRELLVNEGDIPTKEQLELSHKRLSNLLLFNRIELYLVPHDETGNILVIQVTERLYFYPLPVFTFHDRDWDKYSYGIALNHLNFRGQNEKLSAAVWFGYRPGFGLSYSDQWAGDSLHLTTSLNLSKYITQHRIHDFEERHYAGSVSLGKWWNYQFKTEIAFIYDRIEVDKKYENLMHSKNRIENLYGINFYVRYDSRDLYEYPAHGWYNRISIYRNEIFQSNNNYWKLSMDMRNYQSYGGIIIGARINQIYLFGEIPIYRMNYIGFNERIRGHFFDIYEGKHIQAGNLEIRIPLISVKYFSYNLPLIPEQYLANLKFGLYLELFTDTGITWSRSEEYCIKNYHTGFGWGLHFRIPYVEVLRIDHAFNKDFEGQFIVEIGTAF